MYFTANNDAYPYMQFLKLFRNKKCYVLKITMHYRTFNMKQCSLTDLKSVS